MFLLGISLKNSFIISYNFQNLHSKIKKKARERMKFYSNLKEFFKYVISTKIEPSIAEEIRLKDSTFVRFRAYGKKFHLHLNEDHSILSPSTKVFINGAKTIQLKLKNIPGSSIYTGIVRGENQSSVSGYFHKNSFVGRIELTEDIYYLEMASLYLIQDRYKDKVIIYKQKDVLPPGCRMVNGRRICEERVMNDVISVDKVNFSEGFNGKKIVEDIVFVENQLTCDVEVLADHTFVEFFKGSRPQIIAEMLYHVKVSDKVFRNTDLDNDLVPEGIGFNVEKITIIEDKNRPDYPLNFITSDSTKYLTEFAKKYRHDSCMALAFCHRDFDGGVVGKAFLKGLCHHSTFGSLNTDVGIATNLNGGVVISRSIVSIILAHEIGHTFGSPHDKPGDAVCAPGDKNRAIGNYIMYPVASDGYFRNNWIFSPCSKKELYETIYSQQGHCLKKKSKSVCGNGITELGEECDCGRRDACAETDKCCNPPGSKAECTLKKYTATFCSPREGDCCNEKCEIISKEKNHKCFSYIPCQIPILTCDGTSPVCPRIPLADGTPCLGSSSTCRHGVCTSNVCSDNGLEHCECASKNDECHICCLDASRNCRTTQSLGLFQPNRRIYVKVPGTSCHNNKGICLSNGTCSLEKPHWDRYRRHWFRIFWPFFLFLPLLILLLFIVFIYQYLTKIYPLKNVD
ncbi:disintegrin and metalloproteinase domain-containing protein 10-like isoform X2 [Centruroides sculpturatus]|uniref:disintegrin and metalloproteinase domain-containing protein 10-like isoform X2 n=1 Tax=Centruroides sculpturatus TaxID=218467 RepID=UPI000C6D084D|nr:disintegrin and metalloproteinase domain-containing protein 10-like isoform X2 [Centruroides sculpturatus]